MTIERDKRVVLTLDAGGTNFVFSAIKGAEEIIDPLRLPSNGHDLDLCLKTIIDGFKSVKDRISDDVVALSFAFPGPADYPGGIIGDLNNLPAFRGGVALGPMLEEIFRLPVFINNDGNLFVYGEAIAGLLPFINNKLKENGSAKRFLNLAGFTLGTGFGGGIVIDGKLLIGDNSLGGEAWLLRDMRNSLTNIEESISIRAIKNSYALKAGIDLNQVPGTREIQQIAIGKADGNTEAARSVFRDMGKALGEAMSVLSTLVDGLVVLGGGISGAWPLFLDEAILHMRGSFETPEGESFGRLTTRVFNLEDKQDLMEFIQGDTRTIRIPGSGRDMSYDTMARTGVGISRLGTSRAVAIGAYTFALNMLDNGIVTKTDI